MSKYNKQVDEYNQKIEKDNESYFSRTLLIPLFPGMEDEDAYYVIEVISSLFK